MKHTHQNWWSAGHQKMSLQKHKRTKAMWPVRSSPPPHQLKWLSNSCIYAIMGPIRTLKWTCQPFSIILSEKTTSKFMEVWAIFCFSLSLPSHGINFVIWKINRRSFLIQQIIEIDVDLVCLGSRHTDLHDRLRHLQRADNLLIGHWCDPVDATVTATVTKTCKQPWSCN